MKNPNNTQSPDQIQAPSILKSPGKRFLDFLDPMAETFVFQVFDDNKERRKLSKVDPRAKTIVGTFDDKFPELVAANQDGCGVFVTVNRVVGSRRLARYVDAVRFHFVEIDGTKTPEEILALPFTPAWINESSPGKYHAYFNITPDVASNLAGFTQRQDKLAVLYDAGRESKDLVRVMRLPGFLHQKDPSNPFRVVPVKTDKNAPVYSIADFGAVLGKIVTTAPVAEREEEPAAPEDAAAIAAVTEFFKTDAPVAISDTVNPETGKQGNSTTLDQMLRARDMGVEKSTCLALAWEFYNGRCDPPWSFEELETIVANAYTYAKGTQGVDSTGADFGNDPPPDMGPVSTDAKAQSKTREALKAMDAKKKPEERDRKWNMLQVCDEIVYVTTLKRFILRDDPSLMWDVEGFDNKFGYIGKGLAKKLFAAPKLTLRKPDRMVYRPTLGEFVNGDWNQWRPSRIVAAEGDTTLWNGHLAYLFPDKVERDLLLNWLAGVLQQQQVKPMHALLMVGRRQGTGKSFVARVLAALIGESNWQALTQDILANGFTGWAKRSKLVTVEELRAVAKTEVSKKLHPWITQREMTVNEKNLPTWVIDQVIAFLFMSNKPDAIDLDNSDRRYLILETMANPHPDGVDYYQKLYGKNDLGGLLQDDAALGAILYELMNRKLGKYDIAGPAPWTAAKVAMKAASANDIGQWIEQHIGQPPFNHRVVTIGEIIAALPKFMQPRVTMKAVREAMEYLGGFSWPTQIEPNGWNGGNGDKIRVWLLGAPAALAREGGKPDVLKLYREDHGAGVTVINLRLIGDEDLIFGDAADDFADEVDG